MRVGTTPTSVKTYYRHSKKDLAALVGLCPTSVLNASETPQPDYLGQRAAAALARFECARLELNSEPS